MATISRQDVDDVKDGVTRLIESSPSLQKPFQKEIRKLFDFLSLLCRGIPRGGVMYLSDKSAQRCEQTPEERNPDRMTKESARAALQEISDMEEEVSLLVDHIDDRKTLRAKLDRLQKFIEAVQKQLPEGSPPPPAPEQSPATVVPPGKRLAKVVPTATLKRMVATARNKSFNRLMSVQEERKLHSEGQHILARPLIQGDCVRATVVLLRMRDREEPYQDIGALDFDHNEWNSLLDHEVPDPE